MASLKCRIGSFSILPSSIYLVLVHTESTQSSGAITKPLAVDFLVNVFSNFCFILCGHMILLTSIDMLSDWPRRKCQVQNRLEPSKES